MGYLSIVVGLILAVMLLSAIPRIPSKTGQSAAIATAAIIFLLGVLFSSVRYVGENEVGVVVKNTLGPSLPAGKIIATEGEMGPQAAVLPPGWHFGLWPVVYDVETSAILTVEEGRVGVVTTTDGRPLPPGDTYAPEWGEETFDRMLDAEFFLTEGGGFKGPQTSVLQPGKYRLNPKLYRVETVPVTNIANATVGVVKSNVGEAPADAGPEAIVDRGRRGIWRTPLTPRNYYLNPRAYEVTVVSTANRTVRYTKAARAGEEREITVRSSDGFTFPVDVRMEYRIEARDAPLVVAEFGGDNDDLRDRINSAVRAIFRNNAEAVKALDYVKQRSQQEQQSLAMLAQEMADIGVSVTAVRIGDVGDVESLGPLLQTQTDREIAIQEQLTLQEQQRAEEQRKELTRTQQEATEEKRLATARYEVQIAEQDKERAIIAANAEAEALEIQARAQAEAYRQIAEQIGSGNAALMELLRIVGERQINITPRVMVIGGGANGTGPAGAGGPGAMGSAGGSAETTALIGTMLDTMVRQAEESEPTERRPAGGGSP